MKLPLALMAFLFVAVNIRADEYQDLVELEKKANGWTQGSGIPAKLLKYRSSNDGSCFPNPAGTESIFWGITNYSLLKQIVVHQNLDARIFTNAVNRALVVVGPSRFFQDIRHLLKSKPELLKVKRFKELSDPARVRHIIVDSLYITYADMPPEKIRSVLAEIERELQSGGVWDEVYKSQSAKFDHAYEEKLSGGTIIKGTRTKLGNLGDFVLPQNESNLFSYREDWMPKGHLANLFSAKNGDVLILFDKEDLSRFPDIAKRETGERYVLHQVREVWPGTK